jgi:hypothetical protein
MEHGTTACWRRRNRVEGKAHGHESTVRGYTLRVGPNSVRPRAGAAGPYKAYCGSAALRNAHTRSSRRNDSDPLPNRLNSLSA